MNKHAIKSTRSTGLRNICSFALISVLCICCSKHDAEALQTEPSDNPVASYDSTYNSTYDLYVVSDDAPYYSQDDDGSPLGIGEQAVGEALTDYAAKMLEDYNTADNENIILSPAGATMLYSLMSNFTDSKEDVNTFKEDMGIAQADEEDVNSYFHKYASKNTQSADEGDKGGSMSISSNLWMDKKSAVYQSFLSRTKYYRFGVKGMDLDSESSIETVNRYVNSKMGTDETTISRSAIESGKPLATSSVTFKGEWKVKFAVDTTQYYFANANGSKTLCKMLSVTRSGQYNSFDSFDMVEIPYKNNAYSMYVVLPHTATAKGLSASLSEIQRKGMTHCMNLASDTTRSYHGEFLIPRDTTTTYGTFHVVDTLLTDTIFSIRIPKFKLCTSIALNPKVSGNYTTASRMYQTNLPKVSPNGFKLSNVFQTCSFEIDERGTMASGSGTILGPIDANATHTGATPGKVEFVEKPLVPTGKKINKTVIVPFIVDHPFAVFIREKEIGTIPFACRINKIEQ